MDKNSSVDVTKQFPYTRVNYTAQWATHISPCVIWYSRVPLWNGTQNVEPAALQLLRKNKKQNLKFAENTQYRWGRARICSALAMELRLSCTNPSIRPRYNDGTKVCADRRHGITILRVYFTWCRCAALHQELKLHIHYIWNMSVSDMHGYNFHYYSFLIITTNVPVNSSTNESLQPENKYCNQLYQLCCKQIYVDTTGQITEGSEIKSRSIRNYFTPGEGLLWGFNLWSCRSIIQCIQRFSLCHFTILQTSPRRPSLCSVNLIDCIIHVVGSTRITDGFLQMMAWHLTGVWTNEGQFIDAYMRHS